MGYRSGRGGNGGGGGMFWSVIQLIGLFFLWYIVAQTNDKLDEKYVVAPAVPAAAATPVTAAETKK